LTNRSRGRVIVARRAEAAGRGLLGAGTVNAQTLPSAAIFFRLERKGRKDYRDKCDERQHGTCGMRVFPLPSRRLERLGLLRPVRQTRSLKAIKYYTPENVAEVARGQDVSDLKPGPDGNFYGVVSFEQVFRGYRDGKLVYSDITRKNATVVLKTYQKSVEGTTRSIWDVLLSDVGVISTKSL